MALKKRKPKAQIDQVHVVANKDLTPEQRQKKKEKIKKVLKREKEKEKKEIEKKEKQEKKKTIQEKKREVLDTVLNRDGDMFGLQEENHNEDEDLEFEALLNNQEEIKIAKTGRPTDYNYKVMTMKYIQYIKKCNDSWEKLTKTRTRGQAFDSDGWEFKLKVKLPSIEGYAIHTGFTLETIYIWEKKHPQFRDILNDLRRRQAEKLLEGGISGRYNPSIAKLLLSKHGYVEKTESDVKQATTITFARPASPFNKQIQK